jgi:hypothetical protein
VAKGDQTITFTSTTPAGAQVGGPTYTVTATASSGLTVTFTIDAAASSVCSISGSTVSFIGGGTCVIDANQAGNANYNPAPQVQQSFVVNQPPAITSANSATFAPGKTGQTFTVTTTGFPTGASMSIMDGGGFPSAVTLTNNNNGTATISGTPASGTADPSGATPHSRAYPVTITANNGIAPNATQNFTLNITCPTINVTSAPAAGNLNLIFNTAMTTNTYSQANGNGTIGWTITGQPTGLSIGGANGQLTGTPAVTGTFNATVTATDAGGCLGTKAVTITVAPVAVNDTYNSSFGLSDNTQFVVTGGMTGTPGTPAVQSNTLNILTNDLPSGGVAATPGTITTSAGGSVVLAADGTFVYTPLAKPGAAATTSDSFMYTVVSNGVTSAPGTVSLALAGRVWYVQSGGSDSHTGESNAPFLTLGKAVSVSTSNDTIFLYSGNDANLGAAALKQGQSLIGEGVALVVNSKTLVAAGSFPTLGGTLTASGITGLTVNGLSSSTGASTAVSLTNSDGSFTFRSISSNGAPNGIVWNNASAATGSFTITGNSSGNCGGAVAVNAVGTPATVTAPDTADCTGGTMQASTGVGISLTKAGTISLTRVRVVNSGTDGISLNGGTNFTLDHSFVTDNTGLITHDGLRLLNATGTVTISNSTIVGGPLNNIFVDNFNTNMTAFNLTGSVVRDNVGVPTNGIANDGLLFQMRGTSVLTSGLVNNSVFSGINATGIQCLTNDTARTGSATGGVITAPAASNSFTIQNSTFLNNNVGLDISQSQQSNLAFQVLSNTISGHHSQAINIFTAAGSDTGPASHFHTGKRTRARWSATV